MSARAARNITRADLDELSEKELKFLKEILDAAVEGSKTRKLVAVGLAEVRKHVGGTRRRVRLEESDLLDVLGDLASQGKFIRVFDAKEEAP